MEGLARACGRLQAGRGENGVAPTAVATRRGDTSSTAEFRCEGDFWCLEFGELRVTHAQLAGLVGASRPAVCRALRALTSRGSLALEGYRFVLVDPRVAMNGR